MFFYLSKILLFLLTPLVWLLIIFAWAIFTKKPKLKKALYISSFSLLILFSNTFLVDELYRAWEIKAISYDEIIEPYDYGIVLGGMITYDSKVDRIIAIKSFDRIVQTMELYKKGKIKKIFISGGSGSLLETEFYEAKMLKDYLVRMGIAETDILQESESRNTRENAVFTQETLDSLPNSKNNKYLLITSAIHMKRALACYKKVGMEVDPFVTDRYAGNRKYVFDHLFIPNIEAFANFTLFIREFSGYYMYKLVGSL